MRLRSTLARLVYRRHRVCFACGRAGDAACRGHEYGGTILGYRLRRLFRYLSACSFGWVDPRWR